MVDSPRLRRLRSDYKMLEQLKTESSIFDFEAYGTPPDHYVLYFRGQGIYRVENASEVSLRMRHEVVMRLGAGYPRNAPSITWRTPIFHPNIASSGVVCLGAYGQHWAPSVTLDELCHMLWDMLRYANFDVESPYNRDAAQWTRAADKALFPYDSRPLRDITAGKNQKPSAVPKPHAFTSPVQPRTATTENAVSAEVIFLEDADVVVAEVVSNTNAHSSDDEILYIG
jgi:ubiquitin-protein ligase